MKMITDKFEFKKELVIENFKIKLDILNSMIESGFISEYVLIGVCYLDYLSAIFYPNDKANNGRFCRLLQEKGKRDIWSAFYPDLYNQYTKKPINFDTDSEFINIISKIVVECPVTTHVIIAKKQDDKAIKDKTIIDAFKIITHKSASVDKREKKQVLVEMAS